MTDRGDSRQRIVAAAYDLFCERGYSAVGTQEICTRAGVQKGSLYHFFPTKMDIALAALDHYGELVRAGMAGAVGGAGPAEQKLLKVFELSRQAAAGQKAAGGMVCGCLHGNLALELAAADPRAREKLEAITAAWADTLAPAVSELARTGAVPPCDPHAAARQVLAFLHGAMLMAKTANDPGVLAAMGHSVVRLLGGRELVGAS